MNKNEIFSPKELEIYEEIKEKVTDRKTVVDTPTAIVLGGQPGAGKSSIYETARGRFNHNIVELDIDKFREYHPDSEELGKDPMTYGEKTHPFVSAVVDCLVEELGKENYNMIIESPMKNSRTAFWVHDTLTPLGYTVEAHIMATPKEVSWQGTIDRYNWQLENGEIPRYVPKEFHDMCAENIASALSEVYESGRMTSIYIFNRQGEILYDKNVTPSINPSSIIDGVVNYGQMGGRTVTNNANKELIEQARQADLLNYFQTSGYTVEKRSDNYYVKEIAGLCIKPEKNQWYYHYGNVGRTNNSLDCLTLVLGRSFIQSVYELTGQDISKLRSSDYPKEKAPQYTAPPKYEVKIATEKKELKMPEAAQNMRRLFAYFCQSRKIPSKVVEELAHAKLLYQSDNTVKTQINGVEQTFNNANAVFVHKNKNGEVIGGEIQGLNSYKRYKGIASGTGDSAFQFMPNPSADGKPKRAYLFESAIDLMSFYALCDKSKIEGALFVSMAGLKPTVPKQLEAEGVKIISCVDNDDAGRRFEEENGFIRSEGVKRELDEKGYKDWNELLVSKAEKSEIDLIRNDNNIENNNNNTPKKSLEKDTPNLPENPPLTIGGMGGRR